MPANVPEVPAALTLILPDHWPMLDRVLETIEYANPVWTFQRGHRGELALIPLPGNRSTIVTGDVQHQMREWQDERDDGVLHGFNAGYAPADDEGRNPGLAAAASWMTSEQAASVRDADKEHPFPPFAPAFAMEIRSPFQSLRECTDKMKLWMHFGVQLGWLIDPDCEEVQIYRPRRAPQRRSRPASLSGEQVLKGFRLDCRSLWNELRKEAEPSRSVDALVDWRKHKGIRGAIDPSYRLGGSEPGLYVPPVGPVPLLDLWMPDEWPIDSPALDQLEERNPEWSFGMGRDGGLQINERGDEAPTGLGTNEWMMNPEAASPPVVMTASTSWISNERIAQAGKTGAADSMHAMPNFVAEVRHRNQSLGDLKNKMRHWMYNGVQLGWLLDPESETVWIYRENQPVEEVRKPSRLSGENVLVGFTMEMDEIWNWADEIEKSDA